MKWVPQCPKCRSTVVVVENTKSRFGGFYSEDPFVFVCRTCGHRVYTRVKIEEMLDKQKSDWEREYGAAAVEWKKKKEQKEREEAALQQAHRRAKAERKQTEMRRLQEDVQKREAAYKTWLAERERERESAMTEVSRPFEEQVTAHVQMVESKAREKERQVLIGEGKLNGTPLCMLKGCLNPHAPGSMYCCQGHKNIRSNFFYRVRKKAEKEFREKWEKQIAIPA